MVANDKIDGYLCILYAFMTDLSQGMSYLCLAFSVILGSWFVNKFFFNC